MAFQLFKKHDPSADDAQTVEPFGTLLAIRHESSGGAMAYHSEFEIELTPQEIVRCAYWRQEPDTEMVRKTHVPVTAAQWEDVAQTVQTLWHLFREAKPAHVAPIPNVRILDGGDYSRWFLTRQTANGVHTAQYGQPDDRRIRTLLELLRELADPIGREIPRFDPPVLCGVYYQNERAKRYYQCTPWGDGEDGCRFIVTDCPQGGKRSLYEHVPNAVWNEAFAFLGPLRPERFPNGAFHDAVSCTLYFSDGKQKRVVPDRKTAEQIEDFFSHLASKVQNQQ